jgi:hypothetical protein
MVLFSLPYNKAGRSSVLHDFVLVLFKFLCGLNILLIIVNSYSIS